MEEKPQRVSVAGAGVAELPVPVWVRVARALILIGFFLAAASGAFLVNGWRWVIDGFSTEFALWISTLVTAAAAITLVFARSGKLESLLAIKKKGKTAWVFTGSREPWRAPCAFLLVAALACATFSFTSAAIRNCPLPESLLKVRFEISPPRKDENLIPVYFWDYATWVDPTWFERVQLVLPYEKGPPKKLLSKIYITNSKTHSVELELHGRRPRAYEPKQVLELFNSMLPHPRDWPLVWKLEREAGLTAENGSSLGANKLYLMRLDQGTSNVTQAVGVPWDPPGGMSDSIRNIVSGRLFFWGPDGSVFQTRCSHPCRLARMLELVQFPPDPRGSNIERLEWTTTTLAKLLKSTAEAGRPGSPERLQHENILLLYLVSMLTLDPRDPEAFFHLGKLSRNRETVLSAIRYGRDLGLEPAKIAELQATADSFDTR